MVLFVGITTVGLGQKEPKVVTMVISTNYNMGCVAESSFALMTISIIIKKELML